MIRTSNFDYTTIDPNQDTYYFKMLRKNKTLIFIILT